MSLWRIKAVLNHVIVFNEKWIIIFSDLTLISSNLLLAKHNLIINVLTLTPLDIYNLVHNA